MAVERTVEEILARLSAQARLLWGETDAERQGAALAQTAEEIAVVTRAVLPSDLEPQFFA